MIVYQYYTGEIMSIPLNEVQIIRTKRMGPSIFGYNEPQKGYNGSIYIDYTFNSQHQLSEQFGLSTVHGYQQSPFLFVGGGLDVQFYKDTNNKGHTAIIAFANARTYFYRKITSVRPYFDLRGGYGLTKDINAYLSPTVGCRFNLSDDKHNAIHLQLGMIWLETNILNKKKDVANFIIRAGYEF